MALDDLIDQVDDKDMRLNQVPKLNRYLETEPAGVLAIKVDEDVMHPAAIHYWHDPESLKFYFITRKESEKCKLLLDGSSQPAAFVIGTVPGVPFTVQLRGTARIIDKDKHTNIIRSYLKKHGEYDVSQPTSVLIEFSPVWARYTDYSSDWKTHKLDI